MTEPHIDAHLHAQLDTLAQPYVERLAALEHSVAQKDTDVLLLSNAVENLMRQVDDYRERIKKLPKGELSSEVRGSHRRDSEVGEGRAAAQARQVRPPGARVNKAADLTGAIAARKYVIN